MPTETIRQAVASDWFEWFARIGYAAKGAIWGMVGILAARVALGSYGEDADFEGALESLGEQPLDVLFLIVMAAGLFAYAGWRILQAVIDIEGEGGGAQGWLKRGIYLSIGLAYGVLGVYAVGVLTGWSREDDELQDWTATVLAQPFGEWLVGLVGAVIMVMGLGELYFAFSRRYVSEFGTDELSGFERFSALTMGWLGHTARGIIYTAAGFFAVRAAVTFDPDEARGLAETFQELADQPFGFWLVGFVAVGFMAFGIYCGLLALHRHIPNEGMLEGMRRGREE